MNRRGVKSWDLDSWERLIDSPEDYGIYYGRDSLPNVLAFRLAYPESVYGAKESAHRKIERAMATARHSSSQSKRLRSRIAQQWQTIHRDLAWAELDRRLGVDCRFWNRERYAVLARELFILATMYHYWWERWPAASPPSTPAGEKLRGLAHAMGNSWNLISDYLDSHRITWKIDLASDLTENAHRVGDVRGRSWKALYRDRDGITWLVKYDAESILNPVFASIFARLTYCPGADLCPVFLDYDRRSAQPCSVQRYLPAERIRRFEWCSKDDYRVLFEGKRRRALQALCQAIQEWLLGNKDGNQVIMDLQGNLIFVDQDRSFFLGDRSSSADGKLSAGKAKAVVRPVFASRLRKPLLEASLPIAGVMEDLLRYIARVEAVPDAICEGLARNASYRVDELFSLVQIDVSRGGPARSMSALENWVKKLLARKRSVRQVLAHRLQAVAGLTIGQ
jgi:hypothetical protein